MFLLGIVQLNACTGPDDTGTAHSDTDAVDCYVDAPNAMVLDVVASISAPVADIETVTFTSAEPVTLDVSTDIGAVWHDMLQFSIDYDGPVYLRIDPGTRAVVDLLRSFDGQVVHLNDDTDYVAVEFNTSAAIHELHRDSVCFAALDAKLGDALVSGATVLVSESDAEGIVDVRAPL